MSDQEIINQIKEGREFSNKTISIVWGVYAGKKRFVLNERFEGRFQCRSLTKKMALCIIYSELLISFRTETNKHNSFITKGFKKLN